MPRGDNDKPGRPTGLPVRRMPEDWLGVYKTVDEVPKDYRLSTFAGEIDARDIDPFEDYLENERDDLSETSKDRNYRRCYRNFRKFMSDRDGHPICPTPDDIEAFFVAIRGGEWCGVDKRKWTTVVRRYMRPMFRAFEWFTERTDYPHLYNPVLMAASKPGTTRDAWKEQAELNQRQSTYPHGKPKEYYDNE